MDCTFQLNLNIGNVTVESSNRKMGFKNIYWNGWIYVEIYVRCINEYWIPMELNVWAECSWNLADLSEDTINMAVEFFARPVTRGMESRNWNMLWETLVKSIFNTRRNAGELIIEQFWLKVLDHLLVIGKELDAGFRKFLWWLRPVYTASERRFREIPLEDRKSWRGINLVSWFYREREES